MTDVLKLEVGNRYVTRNGRIVSIVSEAKLRITTTENRNLTFFLLEGDNKILYYDDGMKFDEDTVRDRKAVLYFEDIVFELI